MIIPTQSSKMARVEIAFWDIAIGIISAIRSILNNEDIKQPFPRRMLDKLYLYMIWIIIGLSVGFIIGLTGQ